MSKKNQPVKEGDLVFYIEEANEIVVLKDMEFSEKKDALKITITYVTRPYFGTKKLNRYKASDFIPLGEI